MNTEKQFDVALQCRNMEIELFWKRSSFYWVFVGAALVAYGVLYDKNPQIRIMIAAFGLLSSLAWFLGNIGSKWWIDNWEKKLGQYGRPIIGDLFDIEDRPIDLFPGLPLRRFSVTRLAIFLSLFVCVLWCVIFAIELWSGLPIPPNGCRILLDGRSVAELLVVIIFAGCFVILGKGKNRIVSGQSPGPTPTVAPPPAGPGADKEESHLNP